MNLIRLATTTSTMDAARDLPLGWAVLADQQSAGVGRLGRAWESPPGTGLLASFVLPRHPLASLAAGVAAASVCGEEVRLKWPNDLLLGGGKAGGILIVARPDAAIVGVGLNLTWAPPGGAMLGLSREPLLVSLWSALEVWLRAPAEKVISAWEERSETIGRWVRVEGGDSSFEGRAEGLSADGSLIVEGRKVSVGDVIHLR